MSTEDGWRKWVRRSAFGAAAKRAASRPIMLVDLLVAPFALLATLVVTAAGWWVEGAVRFSDAALLALAGGLTVRTTYASVAEWRRPHDQPMRSPKEDDVQRGILGITGLVFAVAVWLSSSLAISRVLSAVICLASAVLVVSSVRNEARHVA